MTFNHHFWAHYFRSEFAPQLSAMVEVLEKRLLPAFANIEAEAEQVPQAEWDAAMSSPGTGDENPADFAEAAQDAGVSHYMLLDGIRQGVINLFAAGLYHAFEQQVLMFLRLEVLPWGKENDAELFKIDEFKKRLKEAGVDITALPSWTVVDELRLVANTVKHGEGASALQLHRLRPKMFHHPPVDFGPMTAAFQRATPRVFQPLAGEDVYVSLSDVQRYRDAVIAFWAELSEAMERAATA
jgi:hypothetical protein